MIHHETVIVECKWNTIEEYDEEINIDQMRKRVQRFITSRKEAEPIALKNLRRYKTAWFEHGHPENRIMESLSDVITGWKICGNELIAVKVWKRNGKTEVEERKYALENYGKTWRCWTAVPTHEQRVRTVWPDDQ